MDKYTDFLSSKIDGDLVRINYRKMLSILGKHEIAMWVLDLSNWKFGFSDDFFFNVGLSDAGIEYKSYVEFLNIIYPDDLSNYKKGLEKILLGEEEKIKVQFRFIGVQNEILWFEDSLFRASEEGELIDSIIGYRRNITKKVASEGYSTTLELRKIIDVLPHFLTIYDIQGTIIDVLYSKYVEMAYSRDEVLNTNMKSFFDKEVGLKYQRAIEKCLIDDELKEIDVYLDIGGFRYYFNVRMIPCGTDKVLALLADVTNNVRQTEALVAAKKNANKTEELKKAFLSSMSHEIRTPLNSIVGFSDLLSINDLDEKEKKTYVSIIQDNTNLLLQLVHDLLDFSQMETGNLKIDIAPTEVNHLIEELDGAFRYKMKKDVELIIVDPKDRTWTKTDEKRVSQILHNFMSNAIKNTEKGQIILALEKLDGWLKFSVSDTGCGIPEDKIQVIFEKFEKLDPFSQGLGLGLSISRILAGLLGGRIEVSSIVNRGSTFSFYLPYLSVDESETPSEYVSQSSGRREEKVILVVKKDKNTFIRLSKMLNDKYVVLLARNGEEAMDAFVRFKPDLVFTELDLLGTMTGLEIIKKIKALSMETPIVGITNQIMYKDHSDALLAGCSDVIVKPYSQIRLTEVVTSLL
ncbi:PAS domain-containing hybrid sensor histidine kinase/response regulator [Bacteroides ihuae]|uniref:PAS domain-containing hybrid sensor histidine kinase/response regulator n=1 Tax=Bacteroides ihuae TaxID=1852362 RepID=UPI0008DA3D91|nr:ATP-binding protein [Bacteroides ihuae]